MIKGKACTLAHPAPPLRAKRSPARVPSARHDASTTARSVRPTAMPATRRTRAAVRRWWSGGRL